MKALDGVAYFHHLHVWELDEHHRALEAHVVIDSAVENSPAARQELRRLINDHLADEYHIPHSTLELETADCPCEEGRDDCGHSH